MSTVEVEVTDPARELAALAQHFLDSAGGGNTTDGLAKSIGITTDDPEFLDVLAAIQRRIRDVEKLATTVADDDLAPELKNEVVVAVRAFTNLLHPKHASSPWDQMRSTFLPAKNVTALRFFSQTARRYRPLRRIPENERNDILLKMVETIQTVLTDDSLKDWIKPPLIAGLERVYLVLRYLQFFGHEAAIADLFLVHQKFVVVAASVAAQQGIQRGTSIWDALNILAVVGSLFVLPHEAVSALATYQGWTNSFLAIITSPHTPPDQRLLPPPVAKTEGDISEVPCDRRKEEHPP
jgi:hypothetical protein